MRDSFVLHIKKFLESKGVTDAPLLLGYSGGPDSTALLHLLLQCRHFFAFSLHIAHIDHGWRKQSLQEADQIKEQAERLKIPLHLLTLQKSDFMEGNLEEQARVHRLNFFSQIYQQINAQALLLGHHKDDQAEVVLKRVFEGASLYSLGGLSLEAQHSAMRIWRPLLSFSKKAIVEWLSKKDISYFVDSTNEDPRFLRARMRKVMLPNLKENFGKEIASNLCHLGNEAQEIKAYFSRINKPILDTVDKNHLNLAPYLPLASLQIQFLLREWFGKKQLTCSRQIVESIEKALYQRGERKKFITKQAEIVVDQSIIILNKKLF